jgi:alkylhydroperoxidase/carboxymuconolactone decarboxylase family protein YurZ
MTQEEREAAYERVRRELGIDRIGTAPDAPALPPRQGSTRTKPASALPIEAEILGVQMYEYGEIWARPGLDLRTRCFITVAVLTAMGHADQLYRHANSALNKGSLRRSCTRRSFRLASTVACRPGRTRSAWPVRCLLPGRSSRPARARPWSRRLR